MNHKRFSYNKSAKTSRGEFHTYNYIVTGFVEVSKADEASLAHKSTLQQQVLHPPQPTSVIRTLNRFVRASRETLENTVPVVTIHSLYIYTQLSPSLSLSHGTERSILKYFADVTFSKARNLNRFSNFPLINRLREKLYNCLRELGKKLFSLRTFDLCFYAFLKE